MADFQYPDLLGQYVRGQMAPGELQAQQQGLTEGGLRIDQLRLALGNQQMNQQVVQGAYQRAGLLPGSNGAGAQNQGGPTGGTQNGPQGAVGAPQGAFTPSTGSALGMLGFSPEQLGALSLGRGDDPLKTATGLQDYQLKQRQIQAQGPLNLAESVASDPNADQIIRNNPSLQQQWVQLAPRLGLDPFKDLTPENARRVATFGYNQVAGQAGLPPKPMPDHQQTIPGALGSIYQRDPLTNKLTQVKGEEPLKDVIGANGLPTNLRASQAEGKQPFNQSIFGAANMSDQALQFAADTYRTTGKMPTTMGRNPAMQAKVLEKVAADAAANGDTAGSIAARQGALKANGQALDQVTKLESATTSYYNTLDKNLNNLQELAGKVDSSGVPLVNKVYRAWQQGVSGDPEVAKYVTYLNAVEGEFAKIQSGSLGNAPTSDAAKRDAKDVINKFMSQGQIQAVAEAMRGEGNNRLSSIREQKQALMGSMGQGAPGSPQSAPQSSQTAAKTVTQAQVQQYAQKHNLSLQAAMAHVKSAGFTVQ